MLTEPTWHKRQRTGVTGPASCTAEEQKAEERAENILKASRHSARCEADKTDGCMAEGLGCNLWTRAHSPGTVSLTLTKSPRAGSDSALQNGAIWEMSCRTWPGLRPAACPSPPCSICIQPFTTSRTNWFILFWIVFPIGWPACSCQRRMAGTDCLRLASSILCWNPRGSCDKRGAQG